MRKYRIALVEQSNIIAEGVRSIVGQMIDFEVVYVAESRREWVERWSVVDADVVVVSTQCEGGAFRAQSSELQGVALVALMTSVRDEEYMRQMDGVINIYDSPHQIQQRLRKAVEQTQSNPYSESHDLSEREQDVLVLVAKGLANKEIADRLNISVHTVISHRKNIAHKTGIRSVAGLTVYAMLNNLLEVE